MTPTSKYLILLFLFIFGIQTKGVCQNNSNELLNEYLWKKSFDSTQLISSKTQTITKTYFLKKPLKPIIKTKSRQEYWEINKFGEASIKINTVALNDTITDTNVTWFFYKNNELSIIKKTGIGGISVKSIEYNNGIPYSFIYGKSHNASNTKTKLNLTSYTEERKEFIEHIRIGNSTRLEKHKSKDSVVFKTILTEQIDSNHTQITTQFPFYSENDFIITKGITKQGVVKLCFDSKKRESTCFEFKLDEQNRPKEFDTWNNTEKIKTHFAELIYDEETGNLKAIISKNLTNQTIEIIKYHYTYYD